VSTHLVKGVVIRLDHIAYRVGDKQKTIQFFKDAFGYREQTSFDLKFEDGSTCECTALEPPEKPTSPVDYTSATTIADMWKCAAFCFEPEVNYHMAPEIFVSEGQPGSIVEKWVNERGGVGGIHHLAYQVSSVEDTMKKWKEKGYAEFCSERPLTCPDDNLIQIFTKPSTITGMIYEFITRGEHGFCTDNVKKLMLSTDSSH
jgi:4-hydroxyphenylpyruvate dioxygenase-like putative hemolysin